MWPFNLLDLTVIFEFFQRKIRISYSSVSILDVFHPRIFVLHYNFMLFSLFLAIRYVEKQESEKQVALLTNDSFLKVKF